MTTNSTQVITWDSSYYNSDVSIYLWNADSSSYSLIADSIDYSLGYYQWIIPSNQPIGDYFKIKVMDSIQYRMSSDFFSIEEEPIILTIKI